MIEIKFVLNLANGKNFFLIKKTLFCGLCIIVL